MKTELKTCLLKEMRILDHLTCLMRNLYMGQEKTEPYMKQLTGSKLGKEYDKDVHCHPGHLTSTQRASCEMLGWMKPNLIWVSSSNPTLLAEISTISDMQMIPL